MIGNLEVEELKHNGLNSLAIKEIKIDISKQKSEEINTEFLNHSYLAVTLCEDAEDLCLITPKHVKRVYWGFDDPAKATGIEIDVWQEFQRMRDEIGARIKRFKEIGN